jgi:hypothetical protein
MDGACLGVIGTVHQTTDTGVNCRSRAHGARLNCSKQFAVTEPVVTEVSSCLAQRYDLSMSGGIAVGEITIPSLSNHSPGAHHDGSHRHFARLQGALGAAQGFLHPKLVGGKLAGRKFVRRRIVGGEQLSSPMAGCQKASPSLQSSSRFQFSDESRGACRLTSPFLCD